MKRVINKSIALFPLPLHLSFFSESEDEELHSTDPESKDKSKDKKILCKVKWSRDEVG